MYKKTMSKYLYPIPFTQESIQESKYTAFINDVLPEIEKNLSLDIINKKRPKDLRAKPELLQTLSLRRRFQSKKIYLDGSPLTHNQENNSQHAIDFLVPIGTPIQAIADGTVIYIVEKFDEYGIQPEYWEKCNVISILHPDNTMSEYIHLDRFSATKQEISLGSHIKKWQIIGYTWASWRMDLPHLHFAFYKKIWQDQYKNIPIFYPDSSMRIEEIVIG